MQISLKYRPLEPSWIFLISVDVWEQQVGHSFPSVESHSGQDLISSMYYRAFNKYLYPSLTVLLHPRIQCCWANQ